MSLTAQRSFGVLLLVAALAGCGGNALRSEGRPGVELTFHVEPASWMKLSPSATGQVVKIIRARLERLGATGTVRSNPDAHTVVVRIDGPKLRPDERAVVGAQARLELFDLEPALLAPSITKQGEPVATRSLSDLLTRARATGPPSAYYLFARRGAHDPLAGPDATKAKLLSDAHRKPSAHDQVMAVPRDSEVVTCSTASATICPGDPEGVPPVGMTDYYLFKYGRYKAGGLGGPYPSMTGADLDISKTRQDFDPATGQPVVLIQFNAQGNKAFATVTKNEAERGSIIKQSQHFAIVLDNAIRSWPQIDYQLYPNGINPTGTGVQIAGMASAKEAKNLALVLQSGGLPARLVLLSQRNVH
jgi:preprotein translocase subunit SecD